MDWAEIKATDARDKKKNYLCASVPHLWLIFRGNATRRFRI
jgi:hypothetical protein